MKTFVLFGSTGDLATRYVLPALGALLQRGVYDHLICVGRRDWTRDDFRNFLAPYPDLLNHTETISYVKLDIDGGDYIELKKIIESNSTMKNEEGRMNNDGFINNNPQHGTLNIEHGTIEITYHLCLSPEYFSKVAHGLAKVGLNGPHTRIIIEKPFGRDLASAIMLNLDLQHIFSEDQIYRVDHYLGKSYIREMMKYRLSQGENWYSARISEIHIVARETLTVADRGEYYDQSGATRDFLQNHLLQVFALATMQMPHSLDQHDVRDRIFQAISSIAPLLVDPRHDILLGQYQGYRVTPGVRPDSRTETYIRVHLTIDHPKWMDTAVFLETGKALDHKESSVRFVFRDGTEQIFAENPENKNNAYETLIEKAITRDPSYFVRWDSVRSAWQVVDALLHCTDNCPILQIYEKGSKEV